MTNDTQTFVYATYIRTTPEKLWQALTDADFTAKYWFGFRLEGDWKKGATLLNFRAPKSLDLGFKKELKDSVCEVLEFDPPRRLSYTFPGKSSAEVEAKRRSPSRVTFDLTPMGPHVKLRLVHENLMAEDIDKDHTQWRGVNNGWPGVLSSLKSLMETGKEITYVGKAG